MAQQRMKRTITGMEAMDRAHYWIKDADGYYDDAVELARRWERSRQRRDTVIKAIRMIERWELKEIAAKYGFTDMSDEALAEYERRELAHEKHVADVKEALDSEFGK
jgi:hypothetical protein